MQYSNWDQRLMDQASGRHLDVVARDRIRRMLCKGRGCKEVRFDGGCLGCEADCGEACRLDADRGMSR
jgi:hypothetical protein